MTPQNPNPKQTTPSSEPRQGNPGRPQSNPNPSTHKPDEQKRGNEPTRPGGGQRSDRQGQQGSSSQQGTQSGRSGMPRYDDRPESQDREGVRREENEGPAGQSTKSAEQRVKEAGGSTSANRTTGTGGLPRYGDRESGDPRRSDVEGGEDGSESESRNKG
jgi:hypothetical protein